MQMERGKIFEKVRFYAETVYDAGGMDGEKMIFQIRSDVTFNLFCHARHNKRRTATQIAARQVQD